MTLVGTSKVYKHPKARTLYITIPAAIVRDSQFSFKAGDKVQVIYNRGQDLFGNMGEGIAVITLKRIEGYCSHCHQPITPDQERSTGSTGAIFHAEC